MQTLPPEALSWFHTRYPKRHHKSLPYPNAISAVDGTDITYVLALMSDIRNLRAACKAAGVQNVHPVLVMDVPMGDDVPRGTWTAVEKNALCLYRGREYVSRDPVDMLEVTPLCALWDVMPILSPTGEK